MNGSQLSPVSMDGTSTHRYHGLLGDGGETFDQMVNGIVVRPAELSDMNSGGKYRLSGGTMSPSAGMLTNGPANNLGNRKTKNVNYNLKNRSNIDQIKSNTKDHPTINNSTNNNNSYDKNDKNSSSSSRDDVVNTDADADIYNSSNCDKNVNTGDTNCSETNNSTSHNAHNQIDMCTSNISHRNHDVELVSGRASISSANTSSNGTNLITSQKPRATLEQRLQLLTLYHQSNMTQAQIVEKFREKISISGSTFSEWVRREQEFREKYKLLSKKELLNSGRNTVKNNINDLMDEFARNCRKGQIEITDQMIKEQWCKSLQVLGLEDSKKLKNFNPTWLSKFKKRHGLRQLCPTNQSRNNSISSFPTESVSTTPSSAHSGPQSTTNLYSNLTSPTNVSTSQFTISSEYSREENILKSNNQNNLQSSVSSIYPLDRGDAENENIDLEVKCASTINELEFQRFLNKYCFDFLMNNSDKYPETFVIFQQMNQVFRRELDQNVDERLRNLFMKR